MNNYDLSLISFGNNLSNNNTVNGSWFDVLCNRYNAIAFGDAGISVIHKGETNLGNWKIWKMDTTSGYSCSFNSGSKVEGAANSTVSFSFGSIKSQTVNLLSISGGNIIANNSVKASTLTFTLQTGRANGGNGNGANMDVKIYKNSTLLKTQTGEIGAYWYTNNINISVSLPALSSGDIIKVTGTHTDGYIDGNFYGTITTANISYND